MYTIAFIILVLQYNNIVSIPILNNYCNNKITFELIQWCTYLLSLLLFHLSEYYITAIYNPTTLSSDSFMINHSIAYTIAIISSWIEFWLRFFLLFLFSNTNNDCNDTSYSGNNVLLYKIGVIVMIVGHGLRIVAMITCGDNFNHYIQSAKKEDHVLVTHGM